MISAFIITYNEEAKIEACLESLQWVDEIVVVDDFSTDGTAETCKTFPKVKLIQNRFTGFRDQKSFAMSLTSNDWVLELDADERVSEDMREAIISLSDAELNRFDAFSFCRLTNFWGKWIKHGSFYPDYKIRLYNKKKGAWSDSNIHERFIPNGMTKPIAADIIHDQNHDLKTFINRTIRYSELSALDYQSRGREVKWHQYSLRPIYTFFYRYIIRRGFLDGVHGLVISVMGAIGTFYKYMKLYELQKRLGKANH